MELIKQEAVSENIKNDEKIRVEDEKQLDIQATIDDEISRTPDQLQNIDKRSVPIVVWQCLIGLSLILLSIMIKYTTWFDFLQTPIKESLNQNIKVEEVADFLDEAKEISLKYWRMK